MLLLDEVWGCDDCRGKGSKPLLEHVDSLVYFQKINDD